MERGKTWTWTGTGRTSKGYGKANCIILDSSPPSWLKDKAVEVTVKEAR